MGKANAYGHEVYWNEENECWQFVDNDEKIDYNNLQQRECKHCGLRPTKEGYDSCIGFIPNALSACCGHGVEEPFIMYKEETIRFNNIDDMKQYLKIK